VLTNRGRRADRHRRVVDRRWWRAKRASGGRANSAGAHHHARWRSVAVCNRGRGTAGVWRRRSVVGVVTAHAEAQLAKIMVPAAPAHPVASTAAVHGPHVRCLFLPIPNEPHACCWERLTVTSNVSGEQRCVVNWYIRRRPASLLVCSRLLPLGLLLILLHVREGVRSEGGSWPRQQLHALFVRPVVRHEDSPLDGATG
jgi:hypothetical protein